jgi:hypothetical protein
MVQICGVIGLMLVLLPMASFGLAYRAYPVTHPVMPVTLSESGVNGLRAAVAPAMKLSEQETRDLIRPMTGFQEMRCPNCNSGHQGDQLVWSIDDPHRLKCRYCGEVYPNAKYPMDKVKEIVAPTGEHQRYPYYEGPDGYPYYFEAKMDFEIQHYFAYRAFMLAELYTATGDRQYARRGAVILQRLAEIYPALSVHGISDYSFRAPTFHPWTPPVPYTGTSRAYTIKTPYPYLSGRWGAVWLFHEMDSSCFRAYDLLLPSGELERLSAELGRDVGRQIETDLLRGMVAFTLTYPPYLGNMTPSVGRGLILAGRILGVPDYVHLGVRLMQGLLSDQFLADGMWQEGSSSYHQQTIGGLRGALQLAEGHGDPPGYVFADDGSRFDDLQVLRDLPMVAKAIRAVDELSYPDGTHICCHDSWPSHETQFHPESPSAMLWSMGQAVLRAGIGGDQTVLGLHFSGSHGHSHADKLDLTLYARGHELIPDLGYTHTQYRCFANSSAAHNVVIVDEADGSNGAYSIPWDGRLELWEPAGRPAQVVSVSCPQTYRQATVYQRTCALVDRPDGGQYVFDLFQVTGGKRHDYLLKGDPRAEQTVSSATPLTPRGCSLLGPGVSYRPYPNEGGKSIVDGRYNVYGLIKDLASADTGDPWVVTFRAQDGVGLQATVMTDGAAEVGTATYPTIRQANEDSAKLEETRGKMLVVRRQGDDLSSSFLAILEPFAAEGPGLKASPVTVGGNLIGARVEGPGFSDLIVFLRDRPKEPVALGTDVSTDARFALIRTVAGKITVEAVDGRARAANAVADSGPAFAGKVLAADREAMTLTVAGNTAADLAGRNVIVDHADGATSLFAVMKAEAAGDDTRLTLTETPDFELTEQGTRFLFFPRRETKGFPAARVLFVAQ